MTLLQSLLAFSLAAVALTITPGMDTAMVLRTATVEGTRRGVLAAAGICLGCLIWGGAVALGLGALLTASPVLFTILKIAGGAYLIYLGARLLIQPRSHLAVDHSQRGGVSPFRRGLLTNLLNPKIGIFYVTFLPQFAPAGVAMAPSIFLLACMHVAISLAWFAALIVAAAPLGRILARPRLLRGLDRAAGVVFITFGARLALAR